MGNLLTELKRRNVFRVAAAYVVGAWILLQVADALFPALNLPEWTTRLVAGLVLLGFPIALIMAWAFEVTADGVQRDTGSSPENPSHSRRLDIATLVGVGIIIALLVWQKLDTPAGPIELSNPPIAATITSSEMSPSLAVLAFDNMSPDPENAFFAEGISEEILNVLAQIDGLDVASRTSAFSFANSGTPIPEIASQLSVNHVLEGSVRKQGSRVRITAQLIDARNDKHLWSDTYNRELTDIFVVQEEIAEAISVALLGALGMEQIDVDAPTNDLVAYELYLSGRRDFYQRGDALQRAEVDLQAAVARDPNFAEAWSYLAAVQHTILGYTEYDEAMDMLDRYIQYASDSAAKALAIDPNQALAVAIQAAVLMHTDKLKGIALHDRAVAMAPNDAGLIMWAAARRYEVGGYLPEALPLFQRAYELDPLSGINNGLLGVAYLAAGERERGREHLLRGSELGWNGASDTLIRDYLHTGDVDLAIRYDHHLADISIDGPAEDLAFRKEVGEKLLRRTITSEELERMVSEFDRDEFGPTRLYYEYLYTGDLDKFFDAWLGHRADDFLFEARLVYTPSGRELIEHPRFIDVGNHLGLMPAWKEKGYPMNCELVSDDGEPHLSCPDWPE